MTQAELDTANGTSPTGPINRSSRRELERHTDQLVRLLRSLPSDTEGSVEYVDRYLRERVKVAFRAFARSVDRWLSNRAAVSPHAHDAAKQELRTRFLPYFLRADGPRRFFEKPRGYAGDAQSIEMIYDNEPAGDGVIGRMLDECFLAQPAAAAVRNRRALVASHIEAAVARNGGSTTRIASLACGPARELFDVLSDAAVARSIEATCVDMDPRALATVDTQRRTETPWAKLELVEENLVSVAFGRRHLSSGPFDLVYSIGLIDYFEDRLVVRLLDAIHDMLAPGGRVILGNFHPDNPDRGIMECFLEWELIHRSEDDMRRIFAASKFGGTSIQIDYEEERINLFAIAQRS